MRSGDCQKGVASRRVHQPGRDRFFYSPGFAAPCRLSGAVAASWSGTQRAVGQLTLSPTLIAIDDDLPVTRRSSTPEVIIASKITQPRCPASLLLTGLYGYDSIRVAVYRVVSACSCHQCLGLSYDRDPGTTDYAIELPLFRRSIIPRALAWKATNSPAHAHRRC